MFKIKYYYKIFKNNLINLYNYITASYYSWFTIPEITVEQELNEWLITTYSQNPHLIKIPESRIYAKKQQIIKSRQFKKL